MSLGAREIRSVMDENLVGADLPDQLRAISSRGRLTTNLEGASTRQPPFLRLLEDEPSRAAAIVHVDSSTIFEPSTWVLVSGFRIAEPNTCVLQWHTQHQASGEITVQFQGLEGWNWTSLEPAGIVATSSAIPYPVNLVPLGTYSLTGHSGALQIGADALDFDYVNPIDPPQRISADRLLRTINDASPDVRDEAFSLLRHRSSQQILDAAIRQYEETCEEGYLLSALSLLERAGPKAWPALRKLAASGREECEIFVGLIAGCGGIAENERLVAVMSLLKNSHSDVRMSIFENLSQFGVDAKRSILQNLAKDTDTTIADEAACYLDDLHTPSD